MQNWWELLHLKVLFCYLRIIWFLFSDKLLPCLRLCMMSPYCPICFHRFSLLNHLPKIFPSCLHHLCSRCFHSSPTPDTPQTVQCAVLGSNIQGRYQAADSHCCSMAVTCWTSRCTISNRTKCVPCSISIFSSPSSTIERLKVPPGQCYAWQSKCNIPNI